MSAKVTLLAYTPAPETTVAMAAKLCYSPSDIQNIKDGLTEEKTTDFIKNVGNKIISTHISDYDFVNERHWLPGEGDIDWLQLSNALKEINYSGVWLYELGLNPPKTIVRRVLKYEDLYNNAFEILNDKTPTPIGKRIENLGFWG